MAESGHPVGQALGMAHGPGGEHQQGVGKAALLREIETDDAFRLVFFKPGRDDSQLFGQGNVRITLAARTRGLDLGIFGRRNLFHAKHIPQSRAESNGAAGKAAVWENATDARRKAKPCAGPVDPALTLRHTGVTPRAATRHGFRRSGRRQPEGLSPLATTEPYGDRQQR